MTRAEVPAGEFLNIADILNADEVNTSIVALAMPNVVESNGMHGVIADGLLLERMTRNDNGHNALALGLFVGFGPRPEDGGLGFVMLLADDELQALEEMIRDVRSKNANGVTVSQDKTVKQTEDFYCVRCADYVTQAHYDRFPFCLECWEKVNAAAVK